MARKAERPDADRRRLFAIEYAKDPNGTQAAIRAGYGARGAHVTANRLLSRPDVRAQIDAIIAKASAAAEITIERTQREIARIAYGDIGRIIDDDGKLRPLKELGESERALIGGLEVEELYAGRGEERQAIGTVRKVKLRDKLRALEQCMSILGMHKTAAPGEAGGLHLTIRLSDCKRE